MTADGKYLVFDAKGNKEASAWLKATKKKKDLEVTVTGTLDKDVLKVTTIK